MSLSQLPLPLTDARAIAVNRTGLLTPIQREVLLRHTPLPIWATVLWTAMLGLVVVPLLSSPSQEMLFSVLIMLGFGGTYTVVLAWRYWREALTRRREIETGQVVFADGEIVSSKKGYMAQTAEGPLQSITTKIDLIPGPYRFYYLPQSRLLVSAEKVNAPATHSQTAVGHAAIVQVLGQAFKFTADELALNRGRKLSPRQRQRLIRDAVLYAAATLLTFFFASLMLAGSGTANGATTTVPWQAVLFSLLLAAFAFYLARQGWLYGLDARNGLASQVEGRVTVRINAGARRSTTVYYIIGGTEFTVPVQAYGALVEGLNYRLHYTPQAKKVLSVEPLGKR
jgi:hypothetical protein